MRSTFLPLVRTLLSPSVPPRPNHQEKPRQCFIDELQGLACPSCGSDLTTPKTRGTDGQRSDAGASTADPAVEVLCLLKNEGGTQHSTDIHPLLAEELYLKAHPSERRARAFLEFCRDGDVGAVIDVLQDAAQSDGDGGEDEHGPEPGAQPLLDLLRYQDRLGDLQSGLHAAVVGGSPEVAWLLLYVGSGLPGEEFPPDLMLQARQLGFERGGVGGVGGWFDVRGMMDSRGRSAEVLASERGGVWDGWVGKGRLSLL